MSRPAFILVVQVLIATAGVAIASADELRYTMPSGWEVGHEVNDPRRGYYSTRLTPAGQSVNDWKELLTIEEFGRWNVANIPFQMLHELKTRMQARCGSRIFWQVLQHSASTIVYEWKTVNCSKEPDQHAIAKILYGPTLAWLVIYRGRGQQLAPATRDRWLQWVTDEVEVVLK